MFVSGVDWHPLRQTCATAYVRWLPESTASRRALRCSKALNESTRGQAPVSATTATGEGERARKSRCLADSYRPSPGIRSKKKKRQRKQQEKALKQLHMQSFFACGMCVWRARCEESTEGSEAPNAWLFEEKKEFVLLKNFAAFRC